MFMHMNFKLNQIKNLCSFCSSPSSLLFVNEEKMQKKHNKISFPTIFHRVFHFSKCNIRNKNYSPKVNFSTLIWLKRDCEEAMLHVMSRHKQAEEKQKANKHYLWLLLLGGPLSKFLPFLENMENYSNFNKFCTIFGAIIFYFFNFTRRKQSE